MCAMRSARPEPDAFPYLRRPGLRHVYRTKGWYEAADRSHLQWVDVYAFDGAYEETHAWLTEQLGSQGGWRPYLGPRSGDTWITSDERVLVSIAKKPPDVRALATYRASGFIVARPPRVPTLEERLAPLAES